MSAPRRPLPASCEGTATLEFALVGPAFLLVVFLILEAGLLLWTNGAMQVAASQTARCTALGAQACAAPRDYANRLLGDWGVAGVLQSVSVSVSVQPGAACDNPASNAASNAAGRFSAVTVSGTASGLLGAASLLSGEVLTSSACYPVSP